MGPYYIAHLVSFSFFFFFFFATHILTNFGCCQRGLSTIRLTFFFNFPSVMIVSGPSQGNSAYLPSCQPTFRCSSKSAPGMWATTTTHGLDAPSRLCTTPLAPPTACPDWSVSQVTISDPSTRNTPAGTLVSDTESSGMIVHPVLATSLIVKCTGECIYLIFFFMFLKILRYSPSKTDCGC